MIWTTPGGHTKPDVEFKLYFNSNANAWLRVWKVTQVTAVMPPMQVRVAWIKWTPPSSTKGVDVWQMLNADILWTMVIVFMEKHASFCIQHLKFQMDMSHHLIKDKIVVTTMKVLHKRKHFAEEIFFNLLFGCPRPMFDQCRGGSLFNRC